MSAHKLLLIGDPHFKSNNLDMMAKACQEILDIIDERQPELCVVLGDTLDSHERIHMTVQAQAISWLRQIAERCPLILKIGNHDRENNQVFLTPIHPFVGLKGAPNITIVDTTIWDRQHNFIYVPYTANGRFLEALAAVDYHPMEPDCTEHPRAIFAHQEFRGCTMGVQTSTKGDVWHTNLPRIFSGHIHEYQVMNNIVYVGTFHQQNYGESSDKAIMMVTIKGEEFQMERIRLKSVPIRATVHLTMAELPHFAEKIPAGCQVRAILHIDATDSKGLESNPYYQALKSSVDKTVLKIDSNRSSLAESMVQQMKEQGRLQALTDRTIYSIEEIVRGMLQDDSYTLDLFNREIL